MKFRYAKSAQKLKSTHSPEEDCGCNYPRNRKPDRQFFQVIVVGAGPAGTTAALCLARAGVDVLLLERGPYPGSKNISGGAIYSLPTREILPDFWEEAPVERVLVDQQYWLMTETSAVRVGFNSVDFDNPPYNKFSVTRATFDKWYASKAVEAGVKLWTGCKAESLLLDTNKVAGAHVSGAVNGDLFADIVIMAEGANPILAERAGLIKKAQAKNYSLYVKQIFHLPEQLINERFHLKGKQGSVIGLLGDNTAGLIGTGSIYTFREHIGINTGINVKVLAEKKVNLSSILERLNNHPAIEPVIRDGTLVEYLAHLIPEGGFNAMPPLFFNGAMIVGDAGALVNGTHGLSLAMYSGKYAADTAVEALEKGDFSRKVLSAYHDRLENSFVLKDMRDNRRVASLYTETPKLYEDYISLMNQVAFEVATVFPVSRREKRDFIRNRALNTQSLGKMLVDMYHVIKVIR